MTEWGAEGEAMDARAMDTQELIRRCLDGLASELEAAELHRLVARDPAVARQLAEAARLESNLEIVMRHADATSPPIARMPPSRSLARRGLRTAAVFTAVAAAGAIVWSVQSTRVPPAVERPARRDPSTRGGRSTMARRIS